MGDILRTSTKALGTFIKNSVNDFYGILVALGVAETIKDVDLTSFWPLLMAILVTVVVIMYWRDWVTHVQNLIVPCYSEYLIDFCLIITTVFLFRHYDQPEALALNFLVLGVLEFLWVFNHIRNHQRRTYRRHRKWLWDKALAILIYGVTAVLINWVPIRGNSFDAPLIILAVILVRVFCFNEIQGKWGLKVKAARKKHIADILAINKSLVEAPPEDGSFLLHALSPEELENLLEDEKKRVFICQRENLVVGYFILDYGLDPSYVAEATWIDVTLKKNLAGYELIYVSQLAVSLEHRRDGVASRTVEWLRKRFPNHLICSFVALHPRRNEGSYRFHVANGFRSVATLSRDEHMGLKEYTSVLFAMNPKND